MLFSGTQTSRRDFIKSSVAAGGMLAAMQALHATGFANVEKANKYVSMIDLPYLPDALQPHLSKATVTRHYDKHHQSYFNRLTRYIAANPQYDKIPLDDLITKTRDGVLLEEALFSIAVLLWNHNFYWRSMKPQGGIASEKKSKLTKRVVEVYGTVDKFKKKFTERAMEIGIGWIWLLKTPKGLEIIRTDYHDNLIPTNYPPLITIDVWEHAYYMDYGNDRQKYVEAYLSNLVNWDFAEANFNGSQKKGQKKKKKKG